MGGSSTSRIGAPLSSVADFAKHGARKITEAPNLIAGKMGGGSNFLDIAAGVATGGLYTIGKYYNDKRIEGNRAARTAVDQQKDAMIAQQAEVVKKQKESKQTANNLAMRQRLIAQRGYSSSSRSGTVFAGASSPSVGAPKVSLLGQ